MSCKSEVLGTDVFGTGPVLVTQSKEGTLTEKWYTGVLGRVPVCLFVCPFWGLSFSLDKLLSKLSV